MRTVAYPTSSQRARALAKALRVTRDVIEKESQEEKGGEKVGDSRNRSLYQVFIVDPKKSIVIFSDTFIALNEDMAKMSAMVKAGTDGVSVNPEKHDIGCTCLCAGFIRPKKETQKVVIDKGENDNGKENSD